jgi:hypothetical protein
MNEQAMGGTAPRSVFRTILCVHARAPGSPVGIIARTLRRAAVTVVILLAVGLIAGAAGAIAASAGLLALYAVSVRINPRRPCLVCGGRGRLHSRIHPERFRMCPHCAGAGRLMHPAVRVVGTSRQKAELRRAAGSRRGYRYLRERP